MKAVITFFAGILGVIAIGVLIVAYALLNPRVATADGTMMPRPTYASDRVAAGDELVFNDGVSRQLAYPVNSVAGANGVRAVPAVETSTSTIVNDAPRPTRTVSRRVSYQDAPARVERSSGRDWKKTAMIIGGSTAAGAGLGGIFGGKKGALIGAAIGGGASTLWEMKKN